MIGTLFAFVAIIWLCAKSPTLTLILSPLLFVFLTKLIAAIYVGDNQIYFSSESELEISTGSLALDIYGLSIALTFFVIFRAINSKKINCSYKYLNLEIKQWIGNSFLIFLLIFIGTLFFNLFKIGKIPVFDCIERYDYLRYYSNPLHNFLIKYLPMISFLIGLYYVHLESVKKFNILYLSPIILLFGYLFLTSNRFSAFFQMLTFTVIPLAIYYFLNQKTLKTIFRKPMIKILFTSFLVFIFLGLFNSYFLQRDQNSICHISDQNNQEKPNSVLSILTDKELLSRVNDKLIFRSLIQPLDLYFLTFQRIIYMNDWNPSEAFNFIFNLDKLYDGNRSIRYLMHINLSKERSLFLEKINNQFGGGYPEILIELFGIWGMWPAIILFAYLTGLLIRKLILSIRDQYFLSSFFIFYVFYAFFNFYVGGMLNFLIAWTFCLKLLAMVLALKFEPYVLAKTRAFFK